MARNKYLTTTEEYNKRLDICKSCEFYFKPTGTCKKCGCFMRLKAKISSLSCPINKWRNTSILEKTGEVSKEVLNELIDLWPHIKDRVARDTEIKRRAIELFNLVHNTFFSIDTNCSSCLAQVYNGLQDLYNQNVKK